MLDRDIQQFFLDKNIYAKVQTLLDEKIKEKALDAVFRKEDTIPFAKVREIINEIFSDIEKEYGEKRTKEITVK